MREGAGAAVALETLKRDVCRAVDARSVLELCRKGNEELSHDECGQDAWRAQDRDKDQWPVCVDHAPPVEHLEQRHNRHLTRDEQSHQDDEE